MTIIAIICDNYHYLKQKIIQLKVIDIVFAFFSQKKYIFFSVLNYEIINAQAKIGNGTFTKKRKIEMGVVEPVCVSWLNQ